jgi:hypothetical protein
MAVETAKIFIRDDIVGAPERQRMILPSSQYGTLFANVPGPSDYLLGICKLIH